ncbi:MAG: peptidoglycan-binding domain-containing protein [Pseudomonadota bacterium]
MLKEWRLMGSRRSNRFAIPLPKKHFGVMTAAAVLSSAFVLSTLSGCAEIISESIFKGSYAKTATVTRRVNASSGSAAIKAAVAAAGKTGWSPKTISMETNYLLAERVPDAGITRGAREYVYKLEVRAPEGGRGDLSVTVTPPTGVLGKPSEDIANEFLDALSAELPGGATRLSAQSGSSGATQGLQSTTSQAPKADTKSGPMTVIEIQKRLVEFGYLVGTPDGVMGKKTVDALKKFQEDNGIVATGRPDSETVGKLGGTGRAR